MARRVRKLATKSCPPAGLDRVDQITGRLEEYQAARISHDCSVVGISVPVS